MSGLLADHGPLLALLGVGSLLILAGYLWGVWREKERWPRWRVLSFSLGTGMVVLAVAPPVADWAHDDLRGHMAQHLLLGMYAPIFLALGMPVTLLLRNLPQASARSLVSWMSSRGLRTLTHPITALILDIGGMWLLYLTPLFALSMNNQVAHVLVHVHFVLAGYLFTWAIAGPDPAPHRPGFGLRLAVLLIGGALHAVLGKIMYGYGFPKGLGFSRDELQAAAQWMYYGGDLAEIGLAMMLFSLWFWRRARTEIGALAGR